MTDFETQMRYIEQCFRDRLSSGSQPIEIWLVSFSPIAGSGLHADWFDEKQELCQVERTGGSHAERNLSVFVKNDDIERRLEWTALAESASRLCEKYEIVPFGKPVFGLKPCGRWLLACFSLCGSEKIVFPTRATVDRNGRPFSCPPALTEGFANESFMAWHLVDAMPAFAMAANYLASHSTEVAKDRSPESKTTPSDRQIMSCMLYERVKSTLEDAGDKTGYKEVFEYLQTIYSTESGPFNNNLPSGFLLQGNVENFARAVRRGKKIDSVSTERLKRIAEQFDFV